MKAAVCVAALMIGLNGCAAAPVSERAPRDFDGFTVVPPQQPGWVASGKGDRAVSFRKKSDSVSHQMLAGVKSSIAPRAFASPEEFLRYVNDTHFTADPHFYEFLAKESWLNARHGEFCVEYRYKYRDYKSSRPAGATHLLNEGRCLVCLHPSAKGREYDVCYSEIFVPGEEDAQFRAVGEAFIDSVRFTEPTRVDAGKKDLWSIAGDLVDSKNRVFFLQQFDHFFPVRIELDGARVAELSGGEVAAAKSTSGRHTVKASLTGIGGWSLNQPELSYDTVEDQPRYFVLRLKNGLLLNKLEILEVQEAVWKSQASRERP